MTLDYLIVGAGGTSHSTPNDGSVSGGGAGGGVKEGSTDQNAGTYPITVGPAAPLNTNANGGDSVAFGVTAHGGGLSGYSNVAGTNGGCGAGGGVGSGNQSAAGSGTTGEGSVGSPARGGNGGTGHNVNGLADSGGGGGGAGEDGSNGTANQGGKGGDGYASSITGTSLTYGAGNGGGVRSGTQGVAGSCTSGYGKGGVGQGPNSASVSGTDGVVIVRYRTNDFGDDSTGGTKSYATIGGVNYTVHTFASSGDLVLTENASGMLLMF